MSFVSDLIIVGLIFIIDCLSFKLFSGILTGIIKCNKNCKKFDNFTKDTTYQKKKNLFFFFRGGGGRVSA